MESQVESTSSDGSTRGASAVAGATSRQLLANSVSSYARLLGTFAIGLIITPYLAHEDHMGLAGFGLFALLMSSVGLINILQQTVRAALVRELSEAFYHGNPREMRERFSAALVSSVLLGIGLGVLMLLGTPLAMWVFQFGRSFAEQMWWSWITLSGYTAWVVVTVPFITLFDATHRVPLRNLEMLLERVAALLAAFVVFAQPWGREHPLVAYVLGNCILTGLVRLVCSVWAYTTSKNVGVELGLVTRTRLWEVFGTGGRVGQSEIATNLYDRTNQVLINVFLGPALNGIFGVVVLLVGYTKQIAMGISFGVEPMAAKMSHNQQSGRAIIGNFVLAMTRVQAGVIFPIVAVLMVLGDVLIEAWLGDQFTRQRIGANRDIAQMLNILLIGSPMFVIMQGPLRIMLGAGDVKAYASRLLHSGILQAALAALILWLVPGMVREQYWSDAMAAAIQPWGGALGSGPLLATLQVKLMSENAAMYAVVVSMSSIYLVVYGLYVPLLACSLYGLRRRDMYLGSILPGALVGALVAALMGVYRWLIEDWSLLLIGGGVGLAGLLSVCLLWCYVMTAQERKRLVEALLRRRAG